MTGPGASDAPAARPLPSAWRSCTFLVCEPSFFDVTYAINPWMDPSTPIDRDRAHRQWSALVDGYRRLGHDVSLLEPVENLPDMVFTANAGLVIDGTVLLSRFRHPQRLDETRHVRAWFEANGYTDIHQSVACFEGEGDAIVVRDRVIAASGPRTDREAHDQIEDVFGLPVVSLELATERWYHLDTALAAVTDDLAVWYPPAFTADSQRAIAELFDDLIVASPHDAEVLGVNLVSDGHNVLVAEEATSLRRELASRGFAVHGIDVSEFRRSGGGIKCVTLDLHSSMP